MLRGSTLCTGSSFRRQPGARTSILQKQEAARCWHCWHSVGRGRTPTSARLKFYFYYTAGADVTPPSSAVAAHTNLPTAVHCVWLVVRLLLSRVLSVTAAIVYVALDGGGAAEARARVSPVCAFKQKPVVVIEYGTPHIRDGTGLLRGIKTVFQYVSDVTLVRWSTKNT